MLSSQLTCLVGTGLHANLWSDLNGRSPKNTNFEILFSCSQAFILPCDNTIKHSENIIYHNNSIFLKRGINSFYFHLVFFSLFFFCIYSLFRDPFLYNENRIVSPLYLFTSKLLQVGKPISVCSFDNT